MTAHSFTVDEKHHHLRLDVYLTQQLTEVPSRTFVKKLISLGNVKVNDRDVKVHYLVCKDDQITVDVPETVNEPQTIEPQDISLNIVYEDQYLIVVNKPAGMLVHPALGQYKDTLVNALLHHAKSLSNFNEDLFRPGIVHRLDRETSGLILIAKDNITHTKLAKQFNKRTVKKVYVALIEGMPEFDEGVIDVPIGPHTKYKDRQAVRFDDTSKEAKTYYKILNQYEKSSLIALYPQTGRTHQLRVHMKYLGHPILGDDKYGKKTNFHRLALHAKCIGFQHPQNKSWIEFTTQIPKEFLL
ncbi:MAG: RluA family pseudouridine synthase [Candidatus Omnitrophica bacterium]|nr:RluA family pseudouridine synthase [Candidatus Omnitrophota bacterium]